METSKLRTSTIVILSIVALLALPLGSASAGPNPVPKVTGGIQVGDSYASFNAFDFGATGDRGNFTWSDYGHGDPGSGVWKLAGSVQLIFPYMGTDYTHQLALGAPTPTSNTSHTFAGIGAFLGGTQTSTISGAVSGTNVSFDFRYDSGVGQSYPGYRYVSANGTIAPDGSVTGTAQEFDPFGVPARILNWRMPAASAAEIYNYSAPVGCASVNTEAGTAVFSYTVPLTENINAGLPIRMMMADKGSPGAGFDTFSYDVGNLTCDGVSFSDLPIFEAGNLTVHK